MEHLVEMPGLSYLCRIFIFNIKKSLDAIIPSPRGSKNIAPHVLLTVLGYSRTLVIIGFRGHDHFLLQILQCYDYFQQ